jgi:hypothetical protein
MRGQRLFRVIGRVLDPSESIIFERLPGTSQFLDAFVAGFLNIRQPLPSRRTVRRYRGRPQLDRPPIRRAGLVCRF